MYKRRHFRRIPWIFCFLWVTMVSRLASAFLLPTKDRLSNFVLQETTTKGSVPVDSVVKAICKIYPLEGPEGLEQRIALSRKDGYWSYISSGQEPPKRFVYGEFDITLLEKSLGKIATFHIHCVYQSNFLISVGTCSVLS